jgi:hypothetical protein
MRDEPDPPRKFYQLKPKEFEIVNAPVSAASADSSPTHVRGHLRAANKTSAVPTPPPVAAPNEIQAILKDNLARANAAGLNDVSPGPKRRSRRKRDYWLVMVCGTTVLGTIAIKTGPGQPIPFTYAVGGLALFNFALWWIMWQVMDDY